MMMDAFFLQSGSTCKVYQFHITNWAFDGRCSNLSTLTNVIEEVARVQRETDNQPIVIHCRYVEVMSGSVSSV